MKKLIPVKKNRQALITPVEIIFLSVIGTRIFFIFFTDANIKDPNVESMFKQVFYHFVKVINIHGVKKISLKSQSTL